MEQNTTPIQRPTGTVRERADRLTKEFPIQPIGILLNFKAKEDDLEKVLEELVIWVEMLEAFTKNNHSYEGLWFSEKEFKLVSY